MPAYPTTAYQSSSVLTASSPQLVVMLYDGARRFLGQAAIAMGEREIALAHNKLRRAENILRHLRGTLDLDQGEIAENLMSIYGFCLRQCTQARFAQEPAMLEEINGLLGRLRDAWAQVAERAPEIQAQAAATAEAPPAVAVAG